METIENGCLWGWGWEQQSNQIIFHCSSIRETKTKPSRAKGQPENGKENQLGGIMQAQPSWGKGGKLPTALEMFNKCQGGHFNFRLLAD